MHLTFALIATVITLIGFVAFFHKRYRQRQPITRKGWFGLIVLFLVLGATISQSQYMFFDEPLVHAAQAGKLETARSLLAWGADANAEGDDGQGTALVAAASTGHRDLVELLVRNGADVNQKSENWFAHLEDVTPLQAASSYPEIVRLLKRSGARS